MILYNKVYQLDCLDLLRSLTTESVDLLLLDPPYFMGKKPFENKAKKYKRVVEEWDNQWASEHDYVMWCKDWIEQSWRPLKRGGAIVITGTFHNAFTVRNLLETAPYTFKNFITWFKPNAMPIMMAKQMGVYAYSCEYILYYTKGKKVNYFGYDYLKELNSGKQHRDVIVHLNRPHSESVGHPTQKPLGLWEMLVRAHCPPDGLVVDFFGGSGTTAVVAKRSGRNYILGEPNEAYYNMILERINDEAKRDGKGTE